MESLTIENNKKENKLLNTIVSSEIHIYTRDPL